MLDEDFWKTLNHYYSDVVLFKIQDVGITFSHLVVALLSVLISLLASSLLRSVLQKRFFKKIKIDQGLESAIDASFREHGIQIPFPQRDLHLRSSALPLGGGKES